MQTSTPPHLEAQVALKVILTDLAVELTVRGFLLVGVLLNQARLNLAIRI
jgi:hypothetical protein